MQKFRIRNLQILVATDVAARGLDVDDLTHIINYGLPDDIESYTHRSGRTGRAGKTGISIAIINLKEKGKLRSIEKSIGQQFAKGEIPSAKDICKKQLFKVIDDLEKVKVNEEEIEGFMTEIYRKLDWLSKEDLIKRVVSREFNRFFEYYNGREEIAVVSEGGKKEKAAKNVRKAEAGYVRMYINLGKIDNFGLKGLMDMLNDHTRSRVDVGKVDLMKKFSFFEVDETKTEKVLKAFEGLTWNGRPVTVEVASEEVPQEDFEPKKRRTGFRRDRFGKKRKRK